LSDFREGIEFFRWAVYTKVEDWLLFSARLADSAQWLSRTGVFNPGDSSGGADGK
jgi:hypothetical protein